MPFFNAMGARRQLEVMNDTWGHLKAEPGAYHGWIEVHYDGYNEYGLVDWAIAGVDASPWFHAPLCTWARHKAIELHEEDPAGTGMWRVQVEVTFHGPEVTDEDHEDYSRFDEGTVVIEQVGEPEKYVLLSQVKRTAEQNQPAAFRRGQ